MQVTLDPTAARMLRELMALSGIPEDDRGSWMLSIDLRENRAHFVHEDGRVYQLLPTPGEPSDE